MGGTATAALAWIASLLALLQVAAIASAVFESPLGRGATACAGIVAFVAALIPARAFFARDDSPRVAPPPLRNVRTLGRGLPAAFTVAALAWMASLWWRLWLLAGRRPPYDWDGLYYHLPALNTWVVHGRIGWIDGMPDVPFVNYPMAVEALTFLLHQVWPDPTLTSALNLWFWPLGVAAVAVIAQRLGARGAWAWWAGALVAGVPVIVSQSVTAYIDPAFAFAAMAALAAALVFVYGEEHPLWARAVLLGATVGLMCGAKGTGLPFALVMLSAIGGIVALRHDTARVRSLRALAVAALLAVLVGGYWYIRNAAHTGNPLYPVALSVGPVEWADGYDPVSIVEINLPEPLRDVPAPLRTPAAWLQWDAPIHGYAPFGGLGYLWIAFALPAAIVLAFPTRRRGGWRPAIATFLHPAPTRAWTPEARAYLMLLALVIVMLVIQPAAWWSRFTIWLHALGLPSLAVLLQTLVCGGSPFRRRIGIALMAAALGVAVWESERTLAIEQQTHRVADVRGIRDDVYRPTIDVIFPGLAQAEGFDRMLAAPRLARSRWSRFGTLLGGVLALPLGARELEVLPREPEPADVDRLLVQGIEWILWDDQEAGPVPAAISSRAVETYAWSGAGAAFHAVRIGARDGMTGLP